MRIEVITIFPELITSFASVSLIGRAQRSGQISVEVYNPRDYSSDAHRSVDDIPFGGGAGMVMKPEPLFELVRKNSLARPLIYLTPTGQRFDQQLALELSNLDGFSLLCGRFEGVDQRVRKHLVDREISLGDYVLAGGEVAAMAVIEAVGRLLPGVVGNAGSLLEESFSHALLEYPHYTRPSLYEGHEVPAVLRSGDHGLITRWRLAQSLLKTAQVRPALLAERGVSNQEWAVLAEFDLVGTVEACLARADKLD